ncbi:hypothetical protein BD413DRAFT_463126 [Trametes elegans]|nr:hypothetical protein BD413DRAFT_463126 [Trametes elegans]
MFHDALHSVSFYQSLRQTVSEWAVTPCKVELDVLPLEAIDMYGEPDMSSAYSLSGHVEVKLTPPTSLLCDPPATEEHFTLESLVLTFEGQSELPNPETGYAACRLVEISQELLQDGPVEIGHFWDQNLRDPQRWLITFNLAVPGWLPPTCSSSYGDGIREEPEVSYRLSAKATYRDMKPGSSKSLRSMCYPGYTNLPSKQTTTSRSSVVKLNRYTPLPAAHTLTTSEFSNFPFHSIEYAGSVHNSSSEIPKNVLSKLRVLAYSPEHIPIGSESFPLFLRLRPDGLTAEERKRLRLPKFSVTATQSETSRAAMSTKYAAKWPVPPPSDQPPNRLLRVRRRDVREYECGLLLSAPSGRTAKPVYSILPSTFPDHFDLHREEDSGAGYAFDEANTWIQMRLDVPLRDVLVDDEHLDRLMDVPVPRLRPTASGPLLSVAHSLEVALTCTYDLSEGGTEKVAMDELRLTLPLSFVQTPRRDPHQPTVELLSSRGAPETRQTPMPPPSLPYAQSLPAYNQLYHSNGMLREDPTPLPRYTRNPEDAEDPPPAPVVVCKQTPSAKLPLSPLRPASEAAPEAEPIA